MIAASRKMEHAGAPTPGTQKSSQARQHWTSPEGHGKALSLNVCQRKDDEIKISCHTLSDR
jgi:hypothetical protein